MFWIHISTGPIFTSCRMCKVHENHFKLYQFIVLSLWRSRWFGWNSNNKPFHGLRLHVPFRTKLNYGKMMTIGIRLAAIWVLRLLTVWLMKGVTKWKKTNERNKNINTLVVLGMADARWSFRTVNLKKSIQFRYGIHGGVCCFLAGNILAKSRHGYCRHTE